MSKGRREFAIGDDLTWIEPWEPHWRPEDVPGSFHVVEMSAVQPLLDALEKYASWTKDTEYLNDSGDVASDALAKWRGEA